MLILLLCDCLRWWCATSDCVCCKRFHNSQSNWKLNNAPGWHRRMGARLVEMSIECDLIGRTIEMVWHPASHCRRRICHSSEQTEQKKKKTTRTSSSCWLKMTIFQLSLLCRCVESSHIFIYSHQFPHFHMPVNGHVWGRLFRAELPLNEIQLHATMRYTSSHKILYHVGRGNRNRCHFYYYLHSMPISPFLSLLNSFYTV